MAWTEKDFLARIPVIHISAGYTRSPETFDITPEAKLSSNSSRRVPRLMELLKTCHTCVTVKRLTGLALPGEPQDAAVVSVSEQVGQTEVAPVVLRVQTQKFLRPYVQRIQGIILILLSHHLEGDKQKKCWIKFLCGSHFGGESLPLFDSHRLQEDANINTT